MAAHDQRHASMIAVVYLRTLAAGVISRAWRILSGRPCPCPFCVAHRDHADNDTAFCGLPTLTETRQRRGI